MKPCDAYNDMAGPIEVEQVTHIFSQETGFLDGSPRTWQRETFPRNGLKYRALTPNPVHLL